jgi:hypothetical protein
MTMTLTDTQLREFVADWYRKLDEHVALKELLPMLSSAELTMRFPETTLHDQAGFMGWYETVTRRFFDEAHTVKQVGVRRSGDAADLDVVVNWQARIWDAPEAKSKGLNFDSVQSWIVKGTNGTGQPVIVLYDVRSLTPLAGSASL